MQRRHVALWLGLATLASCASTRGKVCDYVGFVPVNCVDPKALVASRSQEPPVVPPIPTPAPAKKEVAQPAPPTATAPPQEKAPEPPAPQPAPQAAQPREFRPFMESNGSGVASEVPQVNAVYFAPGKDDLTNASQLTLNEIAEYLKGTRTETVRIVGYTDPVGNPKTNEALAQRRATAVVFNLISLGVEANRIVTIPVDVKTESRLPKDEFWRLRKVVVLYSPATMAKLETKEKEEEEFAEKDMAPEPSTRKAAPPPVVKSKDGKPEPKLETIDVIYWRSVNHGLFILAKKLGYFEEEGFNVRLHESKLEANELSIKLADSVGTIKGVVPYSANDVKNKKYFLGAVCPYGYHESIAKNMPFVQIGGMLGITSTMIMKTTLFEATRKDLRNFRGVVGTVKPITTEFDHTYLFVDRLRQAGLKEGRDFSMKVFDNQTEMYEALFKGEIASAKADPPYDLDLIQRHTDYILFPVSALNLNLPCCRQVVTRENLKLNRPKYVRFERAVIKAQKYLIEHPADSMEILSKFLNIPLSTVRALLQRPGFALSANPNVQGAVAFANIMKQRLGAAKVPDIREYTDTSVYEDALTSLVKQDPNAPAYKSMLAIYNRTR